MDRKRKSRNRTMMLLLVLVSLLLSSQQSIRVFGANEEVSLYEVTYSKADGENGFYKTKPYVKIVNYDERAVTKYQVTHEGIVIKEDCLEGKETSSNIQPEFFLEGETTIKIWMEQLVTQNKQEVWKEIEKTGQIISFDIDTQAPQIVWEGASNYLISGEAVNLSILIRDEHIISSNNIHVLYCNTENRESEWVEEKTTSILLSADGSYDLTATVSDLAGNSATETLHITIDRNSPVIRYVDQLKGSYLPYFEWNYKSEDMVLDYLSYEYRMKVDGLLYQPNEKIDKEGIHTFCVEATDGAGNTSEIQAGFVIDHTAPTILFENVQDGGIYTEMIDLDITTKNKEDHIQKIEINGRKQKLNTSSQFFQFPFQEPGNYKVSVSAIDLAGNKSYRSIQFELKEKMSERLLKLVKKVLKKLP